MLQIDNISLSFGGLKAVDDVSMRINSGKITGLIGPNGAGKTTLFNLVTGVYAPDSGKLLLGERDVTGRPPYKILRAGIARTYQVINLFNQMPVIENVMVGMHARLISNYFDAVLKTRRQRKEEKEVKTKALDLLRFVGLEDKAFDNAGSLSYGQQRKLEIVRALASQPKLLLLDEPAAGMNTVEKSELLELLERIINLGISIFIIEHDMKLMMGVADYICVLNYGKLIAEGTPDEVQNNPVVITAYLGG